MTTTWRLLEDGPQPGRLNMAVDEALFRSVDKGNGLPTLRFYRWRPACVSLGRNQPLDVVSPDRLAALGLDCVRRPTGGRAILHADELTYSVVAPVNLSPLGTEVMSVYRWISAGLVAGLRRLGAEAQLARQPATSPRTAKSPSCYSAAARCDLIVGGKKLVGSAQARTARAFLQHGSLPLRTDETLIARAFNDFSHADHATDLSRVGVALEESDLTEALLAGFAEALDLHFERGKLTEDEASQATQLATHKYSRLERLADQGTCPCR